MTVVGLVVSNHLIGLEHKIRLEEHNLYLVLPDRF